MMTAFFSLVGAVFLCSGYLVIRQLRRFGDWSMGRDGPRERKVVFIPLVCIVGAIAGGLASQPLQVAVQCRQADQPMIACLISH